MAIIVGRIRRRQLRHGVAGDIAFLHFIHVLPPHFDGALLANNRNGRFEILIGHGRGEIEHPQRLVLHELECYHPRILKIRVVLVRKILETALDVVNVPEYPIHQINEVAELREQRTAI